LQQRSEKRPSAAIQPPSTSTKDAVTQELAPEAASPCELAVPMPLLAPTTSAVLPERSNIDR
jgi:hypothetical protein